MNTQEIFRHYSSILDTLISNSLWFSTYLQAPYCLSDECIDSTNSNEIPDNVVFTTGATRACLIDEDYEWVVKFDIEGDVFGSACERELKIYQVAAQHGFEKYLCEVEYIGTYTREYSFYPYNKINTAISWYDYDEEAFNSVFADAEADGQFGTLSTIRISIPLYAYRHAHHYKFPCFSDEERTSAKSIDSPLYRRNVAIAASFIEEFGMEEYKSFSAFADAWSINDLHLQNVGEINGRFCIIDYAGYHDDGFDSERT